MKNPYRIERGHVLSAQHLLLAVAVSPAMVFLLFFGLFHALYVSWAEQHTAEIATTRLNRQSIYTVKIDSVAVSLSSLAFFRVRIFEKGEEIGEVASLVLYEPSLLQLITRRKLIAQQVTIGAIRTDCDRVRKFFEEQATFSRDEP